MSASGVDPSPGGVGVAALTLAVGAILALVFIIFHVFGKQFSEDKNEQDGDTEGESSMFTTPCGVSARKPESSI